MCKDKKEFEVWTTGLQVRGRSWQNMGVVWERSWQEMGVVRGGAVSGCDEGEELAGH